MLETNASLTCLVHPTALVQPQHQPCREQHVGKAGSAVPKAEMEQGGFSGDFSFVYSGRSGFQ